MKLEKLEKKKILILGLGKEGIDNFKFLRKIFPNKIIGIADEDENCKLKVANLKIRMVKWHLGKKYLKALKNYDLIIKSPGVPIHLPEVEKAFKEGKITSQTEIFFDNFPGKIVGVTGTKGKSTTANLIYNVLKIGGKRVFLGGNIGKPILNHLFKAKKDEIFVLELSSHQLFNLKKSPHVAVFINFFPEHLDYYKDLKEYLMAKANICLWQKPSDYLIYNFSNKLIRGIAEKCKSHKIPIKDPSLILKSVNIRKYPFPGDFYQLNVAGAILVGKIFGIAKEKIKKAIESFKTLPHRLEFVGKYRGIYFYNDSLSTIPETTIAAIRSFKNRVGSLILGGFDRGLDFRNLAREILNSKIGVLIFFPPTGERIWHEILRISKTKKYLPKAFFVKNMREAVKLAFSFTGKGRICLLSPASPSFGLFTNYKERGNLFKHYIKLYGKRKKN